MSEKYIEKELNEAWDPKEIAKQDAEFAWETGHPMDPAEWESDDKKNIMTEYDFTEEQAEAYKNFYWDYYYICMAGDPYNDDDLDENLTETKATGARGRYQVEESDGDIPYTKEEVEAELKRETNNWETKEDTIRYGFQSEKDFAMEILSQHYECEDKGKEGNDYIIHFWKEDLTETFDDEDDIWNEEEYIKEDKNTSKEHNKVIRIINDLLHAYSSDTHYGKSVSYNSLLKEKYDAKNDSGEFLVNMSFRPNPKVSINYKEGEAEKILFDSVNLFKDALEGELEELGFTNYIIETLQNTLHVTKNNGNNPVVAKFKGSVLSANIHVRILVDYFKDLEEHLAIDTYDQLDKEEVEPVVEVKPVNESIFENKYEFLIWLGDLASENGPDVIERIIYAKDSDTAYEKLTRIYAKKLGYEKEDLKDLSENNSWEDLWLDSDPSGGDPGVIGAMENGHIIEDVIEADALSGDRISKKLVKKWFSPNDRDVLLDESINPVNEAIEERKSAKKFEVGSEITFTEDSEEYAQLQKAADKLTDLSVKNYRYFVGNTYLDFGSGWQWTTILAKKPNEVEFQVLSPLSWRNILNAQSEEELDAAIDQLRSDEYFHDKIETPNANSSERDIFNYLDSIED